MSRLGPTGLAQLLTNIKTWVTTKLGNYVTTNTTQTIMGKKLFTNAAIQLDNVTSMSGSTMFIDTSAAAPRGEFPAESHRVGRIYIGDNASYNGAWFIVDPTIDTNKAYYRMVTTNPDNTDSTRFSIVWDSTKEGVRRRKNVSQGDLLPSGASTYNLGELGNAWQDAYINKIHGISDFANITSVTLNANTTLTHAVHGRRIITVTGYRILTIPAPEEGSWFLIKAIDNDVALNFANNISVLGNDVLPIILKANETILLNYYSASIYAPTLSTVRKTAIIGRTGATPSEPKNWFKVAECTCTINYKDPFACFMVFSSSTGNTIGTLSIHARIDGTVGVVSGSNLYAQWQNVGAGINVNHYAITTNEVSGTSATITLWAYAEGGWSSIKFEMISEYFTAELFDAPVWTLTRRRQADGDLAELSDTDFTKVVYSTLTTLKNDTTGNAKNVTGTGATTRLNAVKALTNESVGTPTHFLAITTNYAKAGYTTVAQAKTVLGITGDIVSHNASEFLTASGNETVTGTKIFNGDKIVITQGNGYRMVGNNDGGASGYGVFQRVDSVNWYLMVTAQDDALGTWTSARPITIRLSDGYCTINGKADEANKVQATIAADATTALVQATVASNDCFRIAAGGAANAGWAEIATGDDANEPIYVRQYKGAFATLQRTATLLDGSGNTSFPGTVTATGFSGPVSGNASTATEFSANKDVTLTGDVTGTASSKAGWSVTTTLSNSGVTAGTYGPSADVTGSNNATILVPEITVDAKGRVTAVTNRTYTSVNTDNDKRVHQYYKTDDNVYRLLWCYDAGNTSTSTLSSKYTAMNNAFYVNPSTGSLYATKLYSSGIEVSVSGHTHTTSDITDFPTNVSAFTNDAGYLTAHQSLDNYVTTSTSQTISAIKIITGGNQGKMVFKNPDYNKGDANESGVIVSRLYFGNGASYDGANAVLSTNVDASGNSVVELCAINNTANNSSRASLILSYDKAASSRLLKSWGNFLPYVDNTYTLGSSSSIWKECYSNAYYLGTTAFGDIVTHNASEFLTSHQSLSSCVKNVVTNNQTIKSTGITRGTAPSSAQTFGIAFSDNNDRYIGNIYGQYATNKSTYVGLYAYNGTTTSNGDNVSVRVGYDASGNAYTYAPTPATADNSTQIATTAFVKAQGYLTSHQSLANYVTTNTDQSISGIKSHSKHISILGDYIGNESSTNGRSCLYLKANRDTDGKSGLYVTKFRQNVAQGSMGSSDVVFLSHDILENETRTNAGFVESYSNWANDVPGGVSIYSTIATRNLGTSAKPWTNTYAVNFYENGTALSSKYVLNENFGKGTTTWLYIKAADFPTGSGSTASIQYNDVVDGTKLYVWYSVCNSSSILDINPTATKVTSVTGQVWRYLGPTVNASGLGHQGAAPTGILGLFRRES